MKFTKRLTALALILGLLCSFCVPAMAADNWWTEYVDQPMADWSIDGVVNGQVSAQGPYVLFTSDCHRYTYLVKDLLAAANTQIAEDGGTGNVGLMAFGGDFANEKLVYDDNMSILKAALATSPGTAATYTKGNHEGNVSDEEFLEKTGMERIGETAVNQDGAYYFYNFGAFNGTSQFLEEDISALDTYLSAHADKPAFIVSHYPIHYYNDRRSAVNADKLVDTLNKHPNAVFLWGHNHTEQDPNYGMLRLPGDVIQTGASADTTKEIQFTYACLGALRDGINGASGLLARVDGSCVTFRYLNLHNSTTGDTWTDAQGNENAVRAAGTADVSSTTVVDTSAPYQTITLANVQIDRPLVDKTPSETAAEYSPRFSAGAVTWTENGASVSGAFDFSKTYTAAFTLTAEDGYTFAQNAEISVNKAYVGPMPGQENHTASVAVSQDGQTASVSYTFPVTTAQSADACEAATELTEGGMYVLAAMDQNVAASYLYDPAQHGEESMPDYTAGAADVVIRNGSLVSVVEASTVFTAQKDDYGYLLYSDASLKDGQGATTLNFLSMSTRGGELGLEAAETAGLAIYNNWNLENGVPYLDADGAKEYIACQNGAFCFVTDPAESNVRLYQVGIDSSGTIYNVSLTVPAPAAGQTPAAQPSQDYAAYTVDSVSWDADSFAYDTAYTVTAVVSPKAGYTAAAALTGRVNGSAASISDNDGKLTVTYTFPATGSAPGRGCELALEKADTLTDGRKYVLVSANTAMTAGSAQGLYLAGSPVSGEAPAVTADMIFTACGNSTDGYALQTGTQYLAGRTVDNSPDLWGFDKTDTLSAAVTFVYEDGALKVVSTGASAGPGGPPPSSADSFLYLNSGHFNFGIFQSSPVTLYEVVMPFTDVAESRWSYGEIYDAAAAGLMNGVGQNRFDPNGTMTRAMAVTVLYRMAGSPEVSAESAFTDLKDGAYYTDAVSWASANGVVNGMGGNLFDPDGSVTREQFAAMTARYMTVQGITVPDGDGIDFLDKAQISSYAAESVDACVKAGIVNGIAKDGSYLFQPKSNITREQAAAMLVRLMHLAD